MKRNTTLDHAGWLGTQDLEFEGERDALVDAIEQKTDSGLFSCSEDVHGRRLVTGMGDETLLLPTKKAASAFLQRVRNHPVMDDLEEGYRRGVDNPHS